MSQADDPGQLRILVLGTGTGVGKTFVTSALVAANPRAVGLKPIESGVTDLDRDAGPDGESIRGSGFVVPRAPYLFAEPISPHLAAARAGAVIELAVLDRWIDSVRTVDGARPSALVVESAGGAFSPIGPGLYNADLIEACGFTHTILVAPNRLGVLHDTVATLRALGSERAPSCVLLNDSTPPDRHDPARGLNLDALKVELQALAPSSALVAFPWSGTAVAAAEVWRVIGGGSFT